MSWMRASIGVGGVGLLAGVAGMLLWINDGSNYFGVAVALASAGFLTLVACVLARVFGSSHGSQDDAFKRGREMGYDSGYLEGRRTAKPVVVPMLRVVGGDRDTPVVPRHQDPPGAAPNQDTHTPDRNQDLPSAARTQDLPSAARTQDPPSAARTQDPPSAARTQEMPLVARDHQMPGVDRDQQLLGVARDREMRAAAPDQELPVSDTGFSDIEKAGELRFTPPVLPVWRREAPDEVVGWDRMVAWMRPRRIPLLAAAVSLALVGVVLIGAAMARPSAPVEAQHPSPGPGSLFDRTVPSQGTTPAPVPGRPMDSRDSLAVGAGASPFSTATAGPSPVAATVDANALAVLASTSASLAGLGSTPTGLPGVAVVAPAIDSLPPGTPPFVEPEVAAPVVPLTAAEQTAADAAAAAALTAANAAAAADLTAANAAAAASLTAATAKSAADLTAANAAAAAAATAQAAADAAWAVANP